MADLFPDHPQYRSHNDHNPYPLSSDVQYPNHPPPQQQQQPQPPQAQTQQPPPPASSHSNSPSSPESNSPVQTTPKSELPGTPQARQEGKQQATFLTKLYALLERPENHHMIRWDPQGEHIIVEKPEQLAIHVLPSVYRQSRFASFSRQLNIYGFMRKVNLRNVDPAIDDPDASTWSHPTLNRHSPAEVVANFKRRVPPRIPKSKKRAEEAAAAAAAAAQNMPRGNVGLAPMQALPGGRARAFTAPGSFTPLSQPGAVGWGQPYPRSGIPPLDVPGHQSHGMSHTGGMFTHQPGYGHPPPGQGLPPVDESRSFNGAPYSAPLHPPPSAYPPYEQSQWQFNGAPGHAGAASRDLSSLLNPSSSGGYQRPPINTYGGGGFAGMPGGGAQHSPASPSDSRPNTGYSVASAASVGYDDGKQFAHDYSRPGSSHHPRQLSPGPGSRPGSSHAPPPSFQQPSSLSIRRARRHSQAQSPYPAQGYDGPVGAYGRPSTSPDTHDPHHGMSRARSMVQLQPPSSAGGESAYYAQHNGGGDFAYSAATLPGAGGEPMDVYSHSVRPSTGASISTASHASSQANTPPVTGGGADTDISRFSPDFGFVHMGEHLPPTHAYAKTAVVQM